MNHKNSFKNLLQESNELYQSPIEAVKHSHLVDMDGTVAEFSEIIIAGKHLFSCEHRSNFPKYISYAQKKLDLYDAVDRIIEIEKTRRKSPICRLTSVIDRIIPLSRTVWNPYSRISVKTTASNAQIISTGNASTIISNGAGTQIVNDGEQGSIITTGNQNQILNTGEYCRITSSGINTEAISLHDSTQASFSGSYTRFVGFGDYTRAVCNGNNSLIALHGKYGVGAAIGPHSIVKAALSNWIILAEYYTPPYKSRSGGWNTP